MRESWFVLASKVWSAFKDEATAINSINTEADAPIKWYDLQGRELSTPAKGLLIMKKGSQTQKVFIP